MIKDTLINLRVSLPDLLNLQSIQIDHECVSGLLCQIFSISIWLDMVLKSRILAKPHA